VTWEVSALRIGQHHALCSRLLYGYRSYGRPDVAVDLTFFFWVLRRGDEIIVVDTGFDEAWFAARGSEVRWSVPPIEALRAMGIDAATVATVVLTHLHFDHIGTVASFPAAKFIIQRQEWEFWLSELGSTAPMTAHTDVAALDHLKSAMKAGRVRLVDGSEAVADGVEVMLAPGHTPGQQLVVVDGSLVLASDAAHLYDELNRRMLFGTFTDAVAMYDSYLLLQTLAADGLTVVPGHDPQVLDRFPSLDPARPELGVRLTGATVRSSSSTTRASWPRPSTST
jgi:glyoxylase-like metal-dependent hydrolase (beta-lactamase superfamily II)